jgi:glycosyltransferase involved in cell wall biosynthesis
VGFATLQAIAQNHEVFVLTRTKNVGPIKAFFEQNPNHERVTTIGIDLSSRAMLIKKRFGAAGLQWYYDRWQRLAGRRAEDLADSIKFDLMHHVTFASDWARAGIARLDLPFVWGPIAGGVGPPRSLLPSLGLRGIAEEALRAVIRSSFRMRPWYRHAWEQARVVFVQNRETESRGIIKAKMKVLPHSTGLMTDLPSYRGERTKQILIVGRLIPWKGGALGIRAMTYVDDIDASLHFLGDGPDRSRLEHEAARLGIRHRVKFEGALPRSAVLERITHAGALLHPAVHDESPITVGEALSLGTPVVCLNRGGPPELLRRWAESPGTAVDIQSVAVTARRLGESVTGYLRASPPIPNESRRPRPSYAQSILSVYDEVVDH